MPLRNSSRSRTKPARFNQNGESQISTVDSTNNDFMLTPQIRAPRRLHDEHMLTSTPIVRSVPVLREALVAENIQVKKK